MRGIALVGLCLLLSGCESDMQREQDKLEQSTIDYEARNDQCRREHIPEGTSEFQQCMTRQAQQENDGHWWRP